MNKPVSCLLGACILTKITTRQCGGKVEQVKRGQESGGKRLRGKGVQILQGLVCLAFVMK